MRKDVAVSVSQSTVIRPRTVRTVVVEELAPQILDVDGFRANLEQGEDAIFAV